MSSLAENICPFCVKSFPREQLHAHIYAEDPRVRYNTLQVIRAYHPDWVEVAGACEPCWKSFRDAGRILHALRTAKQHRAGDYWSSTPPAVTEEKSA